MWRLYSAIMPVSPLRHTSSSCTSKPSHWSLAFAAATDRVRSATLTPEDAHHMFDELLGKASPVHGRTPNGIHAAFAHAPSSAACRDGPAIVIAFFNRMCRGAVHGSHVRHPHGLLLCAAVGKACNLFHEMVKQGDAPNVAMYSSIIALLRKAGAMHKAEVILRQMVDNGVRADNVTYNSPIHVYSTSGHWKDVMFKDMSLRGINPDVVCCTSLMTSLFKFGRTKEAREIFDSMVVKGQKRNILS